MTWIRFQKFTADETLSTIPTSVSPAQKQSLSQNLNLKGEYAGIEKTNMIYLYVRGFQYIVMPTSTVASRQQVMRCFSETERVHEKEVERHALDRRGGEALKVHQHSECIHPNCFYRRRFFVSGIGWGRSEAVVGIKCVARVACHAYLIPKPIATVLHSNLRKCCREALVDNSATNNQKLLKPVPYVIFRWL